MLVYDAKWKTAAPLCTNALRSSPRSTIISPRAWRSPFLEVFEYNGDRVTCGYTVLLFSLVALTAWYLVYRRIESSSHTNVIIALRQSSHQPTDDKAAHHTYKHSLASLTLSAVVCSGCPRPSALPLRHPMHKIHHLGFGAAIPRKAYAICSFDGRLIGCRTAGGRRVPWVTTLAVAISLLLSCHRKCCYKSSLGWLLSKYVECEMGAIG